MHAYTFRKEKLALFVAMILYLIHIWHGNEINSTHRETIFLSIKLNVLVTTSSLQ